MKDPYLLVKNRKEVVDDMLNEYGYIYCQHCETSNAYKFECHHIIYRSEAPNHPRLHSKDNLIIVCNKCHRKFHDNKNIRDPYVKSRNLKPLLYENKNSKITRF